MASHCLLLLTLSCTSCLRIASVAALYSLPVWVPRLLVLFLRFPCQPPATTLVISAHLLPPTTYDGGYVI